MAEGGEGDRAGRGVGVVGARFHGGAAIGAGRCPAREAPLPWRLLDRHDVRLVTLDPQTRQALIERARAVAERAYAPASQFPVGAAVLADDGRIFVGCNVENASYGLSICAERNAVFHAVAEGARRFVAVAVSTRCATPGSPCGACRQVLAEFADDDCAVLLTGRDASVTDTSLGALLPRPFRMADVEEARNA
ncbi:MAG: cytidine deaminase [Planctomycetota bacterium]